MSIESDSFYDGKMYFKSNIPFYSGASGYSERLDLGFCDIFNITTLKFDSELIDTSYLSFIFYSSGVGAQINKERFVPTFSDNYCAKLNSSMQENSLYCLRFFVRGTKNTYEYTSLIKVSEFTNNPVVKSVTLGDNVKF